MTNNRLLFILYTAALLLAATSCVKDELHDTPHPDYGKITVTADWSDRPDYGKITVTADWSDRGDDVDIPAEPKDVVKNWMRLKNTLEYLGLWEQLNNPSFKGVEFDPIMAEAGSNAFTMSPSRWVELTGAIGILSKNGAGGGTYAQRDIAFKFAS